MKKIFFSAVLFLISEVLFSQPDFFSSSLGIHLPEMVFVEGGTFVMGNNDLFTRENESPAHTVTVSDFYIGKYEVTNAQYCEFLNEKGNHSYDGVDWINLNRSCGYERCRIYKRGGKFYVESGYENYPVDYVTWYGAKAYCDWLSEKTGETYRLPTEAEWEYAARGGNKSLGYKYSGSDNKKEVAWYTANSRGHIHEVGTKMPNELGIYDMNGNVKEWCYDWYSCYSNYSQTDPKGPDYGRFKVFRGGSWYSSGNKLRLTYREYCYPTSYGNLIGFRVCKEVSTDDEGVDMIRP